MCRPSCACCLCVMRDRCLVRVTTYFSVAQLAAEISAADAWLASAMEGLPSHAVVGLRVRHSGLHFPCARVLPRMHFPVFRVILGFCECISRLSGILAERISRVWARHSVSAQRGVRCRCWTPVSRGRTGCSRCACRVCAPPGRVVRARVGCRALALTWHCVECARSSRRALGSCACGRCAPVCMSPPTRGIPRMRFPYGIPRMRFPYAFRRRTRARVVYFTHAGAAGELVAPTALAACCGFDLCHKYIRYLIFARIPGGSFGECVSRIRGCCECVSGVCVCVFGFARMRNRIAGGGRGPAARQRHGARACTGALARE